MTSCEWSGDPGGWVLHYLSFPGQLLILAGRRCGSTAHPRSGPQHETAKREGTHAEVRNEEEEQEGGGGEGGRRNMEAS